mmetsp:Transcript_32971/g.55275  ORF Transcript_32971/g.55275 Transcript_32971/m.55275 type:complete len:235 (-) Transcript_32971:1292-1996(-)
MKIDSPNTVTRPIKLSSLTPAKLPSHNISTLITLSESASTMESKPSILGTDSCRRISILPENFAKAESPLSVLLLKTWNILETKQRPEIWPSLLMCQSSRDPKKPLPLSKKPANGLQIQPTSAPTLLLSKHSWVEEDAVSVLSQPKRIWNPCSHKPVMRPRLPLVMADALLKSMWKTPDTLKFNALGMEQETWFTYGIATAVCNDAIKRLLSALLPKVCLRELGRPFWVTLSDF